MIISLALLLTANSPLKPLDPPLDKQEFLFYDVNVVPMDRARILPMTDVLVRDGKIVDIHPSDLQNPPKTGRFLDGKGEMYLTPGLADMHFHLYYAGDLLSLLANGVTTIRNMRGRPSDLKFRQQIRDGELPGPTIFTAGPILGGPKDGFLNVKTAAQAVQIIDEQHKEGYDFIKVYDGLPKAPYLAGRAEAKRLGMQFCGHIPSSVRVDGALAAHQDSLEHAEQFVYHYFDKSMDETQIPALAKRVKASGCYVCPTMELIHNYIELVENPDALLNRPEARFANPEVRAWWKTIKKSSSGQNRLIAYFQAKMIKDFADEGVQLLSGTDTHLVGFVPGFSLHREFACMADAGLTPFQVLQSSTANAGRYLHRRTGIIAVGNQADLVVTHHNPLESLDALKDREGVMVRGKWYRQSELDGMMENLVKSYGPGN